MSQPLFPVFLQLSNRPCLLIGGDESAVEKVEQLLAAGANLTIVAPQLAKKLKAYAEDKQLVWLQTIFQKKHMEGMWLAVSTLKDTDINRHIHAEANSRDLFLNVVDQPEFCTFQWPATLHRPPVTVAFSTGGESPALSGYLRRNMEKFLPEEMEALAHWLSVWRQQVSLRIPSLEARGRFWRTLLDQGITEHFLSGDKAGADRMIHHALEHAHFDTSDH